MSSCHSLSESLSVSMGLTLLTVTNREDMNIHVFLSTEPLYGHSPTYFNRSL